MLHYCEKSFPKRLWLGTAILPWILAGQINVAVAAPIDPFKWTGAAEPSDGDFETGGNWAGGTAPKPQDDATIDNGSTVTRTTVQDVGHFDEGSLTISGGSSLINEAAVNVGNKRNDVGSVTVDDNSAWSIGGNMFVGTSGIGVVTIRDGGSVTTTGLSRLGNGFFSHGTVEVRGNWTTTGALQVGYNGTGVMAVNSGGSVTTEGNAWLGVEPGTSDTSGTATVTGLDSLWTTKGDLEIGRRGTGYLDVLGGGTVTSQGNAFIGRSATDTEVGVGIATVDGAGSTWSIGGFLAVGTAGDGTLNIKNGGQVTTGGVAFIARDADSTGTVTLDGTDARSSWTVADFLSVGNFGEGALTVSDGSSLISEAAATVGTNDGAKGTTTVTGANSTWTISDQLLIGDYGDGSLTVSHGGSVTTGSSAWLGSRKGASGTAMVTGQHSLWTTQGDLEVGRDGTGTLEVRDGGTVTSQGNAYIGKWANSTSSAAVDGNGSSWTIGGYLLVGNNGDGLLTVSDGGRVTTTDFSYLANTVGSRGAIEVTGPESNLTTQGALEVGRYGAGSLDVNSGGSVTTGGGAWLGSQFSALGTATVTGQDSLWTTNGELIVGRRGTGTLDVESGGTVISHGDVFIATNELGVGTATVDGAGSSWTVGGDMYVGGKDTRPGGSGQVNALGGSSLAVGGGMLIYGGGGVLIDQSFLTVDAVDNRGLLDLRSTQLDAPLMLASQALTRVEGTVDFLGPVTGGADFIGSGEAVFHDLYRPANSIASPTFQGDFTLAPTGLLSMQISSEPDVHDSIHVGGTATFRDGSTLRLVKIGEGPVQTGQRFRLITADGGIVDEGLVVDTDTVIGYVGFSDGGALFVDVSSTDLSPFALSANAQRLATGMDRDTDAGLTANSDYWRMVGDLQALSPAGLGDTFEAMVPATLAAAAPAHHYAVQTYHATLADHMREEHYHNPQGEWTTSARVYRVFDRAGSDGERISYDANTSGIVAAADYQVTDQWRLGFATGYQQTGLSQTSGSGTIDTVRVGPHFGYEQGPLSLDAAISYGHSSFDMERDPGIGGALTSRYQGYDVASRIGGRYEFRIGDNTTITPEASLQHVYLHQEGFTESGDSGAALIVASRSSQSLGSTVGVRVGHEWQLDQMKIVPEVSLAWHREWMADDIAMQSRFAGGSTSFTTELGPERGNSLQAGLDLSLVFSEQVTGFARYQGRFYENNADTHALSGGISLRF